MVSLKHPSDVNKRTRSLLQNSYCVI